MFVCLLVFMAASFNERLILLVAHHCLTVSHYIIYLLLNMVLMTSLLNRN